MNVKGIIFDLDGTLLNTLEDIALCMNKVLKELGLPTHPISSYRYFVGEGITVLVQKVLPREKISQELIDLCKDKFYSEYSNSYNLYTKPYDNIPQLLDELTKRGLKLAILSNKPHAIVLDCVNHYLNRWKFDIVQGFVESKPRKPDPTTALEIASILNLQPEEIYYIGDSAIDMQTATRANMFPIGALWGFRTKEELIQHGAKILLDNPLALLKYLT